VPLSLGDRFTPTAVGLVSRAWVIAEVERSVAEPTLRPVLVETLIAYEPPRRHGIRNNVIVWGGLLGCTMLAGAAGLPGWAGFVAALAVFVALARVLAVRALRWRLAQLLQERAR
jgi:hypothetical protein